MYWALTSILGAQAEEWRLAEIEEEWRLNTAEKVRTTDPAIYDLLTDPTYKFPPHVARWRLSGKLNTH